MSPWTFNQKNVTKCCKEILLPDGKQIPFCAYNNVGYREQTRVQLEHRTRAWARARHAVEAYSPPPLTFSFDTPLPEHALSRLSGGPGYNEYQWNLSYGHVVQRYERSDRSRKGTMTAEYSERKACCAAVHLHDWVRVLLGESFHPGGLALTERLGELLVLGRNSVLLDVASGHGASALHVARVFRCRVVGVDLSALNIARAVESACAAGIEDLVEFRVGDGEHLPLPDASVDTVLCECNFCIFPSKEKAAEEFARSAARRRGRSLRTDLLGSVARRARRSPRLDRLHRGCTTGAGVRAIPVRRRSLRSSGRTARRGAWRDGDWNPGQTARAELLLKLGKLSLPQMDTDGARVMAQAAEQVVREGQLGYTVIVARKEGSHHLSHRTLSPN